MSTPTSYRVEGMTCEHCVKAVDSELRSLPGVSEVSVHLVPGGVSWCPSPATPRWRTRQSRRLSTRLVTPSPVAAEPAQMSARLHGSGGMSTTSSAQGSDADQRSTIELVVDGMMCASCAARIEKRLNRLDGVTATVNYAIEKAWVTYPAGLVPQDLIATVEATGNTATAPADPTDAPPAGAAGAGPVPDDAASWRQRLLICLALTLPVLAMAMLPALRFRNWQWASLTHASPVVVWGGWPFHRAAWVKPRHRAATMDTLISMGVSAAYLWSLWALFVGDAGMPGMPGMSFTLLP